MRRSSSVASTRSALLRTHHRPRAGLPRRDDEALDAPRVEVAVEPGDEEQHVDVRGHDLLARRAARVEPRERAGAREHGVDDRRPVGGRLDRDPVADRGQVGRALRLVAQAPAHHGRARRVVGRGQTSRRSRSARATRAGTRPRSANGANAAAWDGLNPRATSAGGSAGADCGCGMGCCDMTVSVLSVETKTATPKGRPTHRTRKIVEIAALRAVAPGERADGVCVVDRHGVVPFPCADPHRAGSRSRRTAKG